MTWTTGVTTGAQMADDWNNLSGFLISSDKINNSPLYYNTGSGVVITDAISAATLPKTWGRKSDFFSNLGGTIVDAGASYPNNLFITSDGTVDYGTGTAIKPIYSRSFYFFGDKFEMHYKEANSQIDISINNEVVGGFTAPSTGNLKYFSVDLGSKQFVRVDVLCTNAITGDVYTDNDDNIYAVNSGIRVVVAGDSFTEGIGAPFGLGYAEYIRKLTGSFDIINSGSGGTGYLKENSGRPNLLDRYQTDIIDLNPDVILIAMGINDLSLDLGLVTQAIDDIYSAIKNQTSVNVVILGSWTSGEASQTMIDLTAVIESKAIEYGFIFINPTGTGNNDGWITGTGNDSAPTGDGNADVFISSDGTHPSELGHHYIATRLLQELYKNGIQI